MMNRGLTAAFALILAGAAPAWAINPQAGTSGAQFLKLGAGARAGGMADSFSAVADDAYAAYYNPAGLSQIKGPELAGAHTAYFQGINYEVLEFAYPWGRGENFSRHVLAAGIYQLSVADIERRTNDTTDANGTFGASDGAYCLSYAYAFDRRLRAGVTGKYIVETLDAYKATAYAVDAGVLYQLNPAAARPMSVSAVVRNFGSKLGYAADQKDPLPVSITLGAGMQAVPKRLRLNLELTKYSDNDLFVAMGGEYSHAFSEALTGALRGGYSSQRMDTEGLNGISFGAGMTFRKAAFDFAWIPFGVLGDTFRYSLIVKF